MADNSNKDEGQKADVKGGVVKPQNDLERTGRVNTKVETQTIVEDRTDNSEARPAKPVVEKHEKLQGGTVLTTYHDADEASE